MISIEDIYVNFGGFDLFKGISFLINPRDRIGLIGKNGAGKTTLLKIIAKIDQPSSGLITFPRGMTFGYLPQTMKLSNTRSLKKETTLAFDELLKLKKDLAKTNNEIVNREDYESSDYMKLIEKSSHLNERIEILGGDNYEAEVEQVLIGLGFKRSDFDRPTSEFSGGWRMRIELAKILLKKPNLFLLDEPTNHLDIESIQWLEDFLKDYRGAIMLVSHDKAFLNNVTNRTIELSLGKTYSQTTNYSGFLEWKKELREQQLAAYNNQQKMIIDIEQFIERFRYKATKAVQVQSRIKQLEKIDRIEIEPEDNASLKMKFPPAPRSGAVIVKCEEVSKSYGQHEVLKNIDMSIERHDKLAFVGKNGEGKTTLARMILKELEFEGNLELGHNIKVGYFAQNQPDLLNENKSVFETIDDIATGEVRTKIRNILGAFMFSGEDVEKKVKVLSGGERSRLAMIKLLLEPVNFLILDEPTNHLDIKSKEILKNALIDFDGTILIISHDREFLDGLVNCVYEFKDKKVKQHLGGIYDFLQKKRIESLRELEIKKNTSSSNNKSVEISNSKQLSFEQKKEINRTISKFEKEVSSLEASIAKIESRISRMDIQMEDETKVDGHEFFKEYDDIKLNLEKMMIDWEGKNDELENWKLKKTW